MEGSKPILTDLKPLRLGKRVANLGRKAPPIVLLATGEPAASPDEARNRWREHFARMEGGRDVTADGLVLRQQPMTFLPPFRWWTCPVCVSLNQCSDIPKREQNSSRVTTQIPKSGGQACLAPFSQTSDLLLWESPT